MKRALVLVVVLLASVTLTTTLAFSQKTIELKHFNWRPEDLEKWGKIYDEFMQENPDIKLIDDPIPAANYFNNLEINLEGKQADPICSIWQNGCRRTFPKWSRCRAAWAGRSCRLRSRVWRKFRAQPGV